MATPSSDNPATFFGFRDLNGFKDFVVYVLACAPDQFPVDDWLGPDEQMNLDRAFRGLRYGLTVTLNETGASEIIGHCRELIDRSYVAYQEGVEMAGQANLEEVERLLKKLPSQ